MQQQALNLMSVGTVEAVYKARELFERQVQLCSHNWGKRIPLYNLACCESILGRFEQALARLKEAVAAGYHNVKHMESDDDLKPLRETFGFQELISTLKSGHRCRGWRREWGAPQPEQQQQAEPEQEQPEESAPEQPEQPAESIPEKFEEPALEQPEPVQEEEQVKEEEEEEGEEVDFRVQMGLLAEMGFICESQNIEALLRTGGNVTQALDLLINFTN
jgi:hypothetical protein